MLFDEWRSPRNGLPFRLRDLVDRVVHRREQKNPISERRAHRRGAVTLASLYQSRRCTEANFLTRRRNCNGRQDRCSRETRGAGAGAAG
jgi:hypothetical protein